MFGKRHGWQNALRGEKGTPGADLRADRTKADRGLRFYQLFGFVIVCLFVGWIGGWAAWASINGAIIAPATVVVETDLQKVQHREGGIIAKIFVKDGDHVEADQLLLRLDRTETQANLAVIDAQYLELEARKARLVAERDDVETIAFPPVLEQRRQADEIGRIIFGQEKLFKARRETRKAQANQLVHQVAQLEDDIAGLLAQQKAKKNQFDLMHGQLGDLTNLFRRGLVTRERLVDLRYNVVELQGQIGQFTSQVARTRGQINEIKYRFLQEKQEFRRDVLAELREVQTTLSGLQEQRIAAQVKLKRVDIRSPRAGTVHQSSAYTVGGVVNAGEPIMLIVPETDKLVLEASVQPQDIDQISIGQEAIIRMTAFDQRATPELAGKVAHISADLARVDPGVPPYYVVRIELPAEEIARLGDKVLKPGMPADAFIQTGKRTALNYLLKPVLDQFKHVFRET